MIRMFVDQGDFDSSSGKMFEQSECCSNAGKSPADDDDMLFFFGMRRVLFNKKKIYNEEQNYIKYDIYRSKQIGQHIVHIIK